MKIPPGMIEMFMKSAGAPPALIELYRMIVAEGFGSFRWAFAGKDDPNWVRIGAEGERHRTGIWMSTEGTDSKLTVGIFLEGGKDEIVQKLEDLGHGPNADSRTVEGK